jgi:hypothetical protein
VPLNLSSIRIIHTAVIFVTRRVDVALAAVIFVTHQIAAELAAVKFVPHVINVTHAHSCETCTTQLIGIIHFSGGRFSNENQIFQNGGISI